MARRRLKPLKEEQDYFETMASKREREKFWRKSFESKIHRGGEGYPLHWSGPLPQKSARKVGRQARAYRMITAKAIRERKYKLKTKGERRTHYKKVARRVAGLHEVPGWGKGRRGTVFDRWGAVQYAKISGYERKRKGMRYPELYWSERDKW